MLFADVAEIGRTVDSFIVVGGSYQLLRWVMTRTGTVRPPRAVDAVVCAARRDASAACPVQQSDGRARPLMVSGTGRAAAFVTEIWPVPVSVPEAMA
ncbi:hypothetical protein GCM10028832_01860 [Streptomyces sparsus]